MSTTFRVAMLQPRPPKPPPPPGRVARRRARYALDARSRAPRAFQARSPLPIYPLIMLAHPRTLPTGFIAPCLPTKAETLPSGGAWLHEIKHDGFRIIACKDGERVRLFSRPGNDFTHRFPLIVETLACLRSRSCIIDGEAVACDDNGVASFDLIRHHRHNDRAFLYAFDLIDLNPHSPDNVLSFGVTCAIQI